MAVEILEVPPSSAGDRLDRFLARALAVPVERARTLVTSGQVRIRGRTCSVHRKLFGGEAIEVDRPAARREAVAGPDLAEETGHYGPRSRLPSCPAA